MSRTAASRLGFGLVGFIFAFLAWSLAYEVVVAARWRASMPGDGGARWALLQVQNADRTWSGLFVAWNHFYARIAYPATQAETLTRALIAFGVVAAIAIGAAATAWATRRPMPYGSARIGTIADAEKKNMTTNKGLILGLLNGTTLTSNDPSHVLVVGPSRSGKGISFIVPNGYAWQGSSVWFDPKQENFGIFGAHRQALGDKVFMYAPGQVGSHRYNPLDFIRRGPLMPTDSLVVSSFIVPETGAEIWGRAATLLLAAMIGYVLSAPRYEGSRHLRSVSRLTTTGTDFKLVMAGLVKAPDKAIPGWVIDGFNQFLSVEPETRNSALFNLNIALNPWNSGLIAAATETSDFDIRNLRRERMAIFIGCSVSQLKVFGPLVKILIQQIHDVFADKKPGNDEPYQVLLMIDEFRQLNRMDALVSKLPISAGSGFRMVLILQSIAQLDEVYGKAVRTSILNDCQVKLFIRLNDLDSSDYVSEMMGNTTVEIKTPIIRPGQGLFAAREKSIHYQERPLRSPQDLRLMSEKTAIAIVPNAPAFELRKLIHFEDQPYKAVYDENLFKRLQPPTLHDWEDKPLVGDAQPREAVQDSKSKAAVRAAAPHPAPAPVAVEVKSETPSPERTVAPVALTHKVVANREPEANVPLDRANADAPVSPVGLGKGSDPVAPRKVVARRGKPPRKNGADDDGVVYRVDAILAGTEALANEQMHEVVGSGMAVLADPAARGRLKTLKAAADNFGEL